MRRSIRFILAMLLAVPVVGGVSNGAGAAEEGCDNGLIVLSGTGVDPSLSPTGQAVYAKDPHNSVGVFFCDIMGTPEDPFTPADDPDWRIIHPGSNLVVIRYIFDTPGETPTLTANVSGPVLDGSFTLTRGRFQPLNPEDPPGPWKYDSAPLAISPAAIGEMVVNVTLPDGTDLRSTYRTTETAVANKL